MSMSFCSMNHRFEVNWFSFPFCCKFSSKHGANNECPRKSLIKYTDRCTSCIPLSVATLGHVSCSRLCTALRRWITMLPGAIVFSTESSLKNAIVFSELLPCLVVGAWVRHASMYDQYTFDDLEFTGLNLCWTNINPASASWIVSLQPARLFSSFRRHGACTSPNYSVSCFLPIFEMSFPIKIKARNKFLWDCANEMNDFILA